VSFLRKPRYRFVLWAVILVAVAAVTGILGLDWWLIVVIVFAVWVVLTIVERRLDRAAERPAPVEVAPAVAPPPPVSQPEAATPEVPVARRRRLRSPRTAVPVSAAAPSPEGEKQWSIWTLDRVARETTDAELRFLVLSLQEYADSDGMLPLQFDPLVRESFGELLGTTG